MAEAMVQPIYISKMVLKTFKELLNTHTKALYINELIGRGANIITGDYSVGASGMLIENGEFSYPINEITIAGKLIRNVQ